MYAEPEDHGMSRGSDLAQVFNMPRDARRHHATALPDTVPPEPHTPNRLDVAATPVPAPPIEPVAQAGLQALQGLDLALFDGGDAAQVLAEEDLLKVTGIQPPHPRSNSTPTHTTQPASPSASTSTAAGAHAPVQTTVASSRHLPLLFSKGRG